jgi:hypothetical protein
MTPPVLRRNALAEAGGFEQVKALLQQGGRDFRHAAMDVVEATATVNQTADNKHRPSLAQEFGGERKRTILAIAPVRHPRLLSVMTARPASRDSVQSGNSRIWSAPDS